MVGARINEAPLLWCAPGNHHSAEDFKEIIGDIDQPRPWYLGHPVKIKFVGPAIHPVLHDLVVNVWSEWTNRFTNAKFPDFKWVSRNEDADIRISIDPDVPSWSAIGTQARKFAPSNATTNLCLGGWKAKNVVYSHQQLRRQVAHFLGHALGLPHGKSSWSSPWDIDQLESECGKVMAPIIASAQGNTNLTGENSIMLFDRPSILSKSKVDEHKGGWVIDEQSVAFLKDIYQNIQPEIPTDIFHGSLIVSSSIKTGGIWDNWSGKVTCTQAAQCDIVTAFRALHLKCDRIHKANENDTYRLRAQIAVGPSGPNGYEVSLSSWGESIMSRNTQCDFLSFTPDDKRIQTSWTKYDFGAQGLKLNDTKTEEVTFARPFKNTPKVVAFISMFDVVTDSSSGTALMVQPQKLRPDGFEIWYGADNEGDIQGRLANMGVSWLAHEADDWSIRSGNTRVGGIIKFDKPFDGAPRYVVGGYSWIYSDKKDVLDTSFTISDVNERQFTLNVDPGNSLVWSISWIAFM